jgi:hypothetical protein
MGIVTFEKVITTTVEDSRIKMGLWGQGNSIEVRCWVF